MSERAGRRLPDIAWRGEAFDLTDLGAQRASAVVAPDGLFWAARLDDADKHLPLRTWVTEVCIGEEGDGTTLFGARVVCVSRGIDEPIDRTIPKFVRLVLDDGPSEFDGVLVTPQVSIVSTDGDVDQVVGLLENPYRKLDVVLFALSDESCELSDAAANASSVHRATRGSAHVYVLSGPASYLFTDRVGRELSVFRRGVRTYRPGFRAWIDEPSRHPLALPDRIVPGEFEKRLVNQLLGNAAHVPNREETLPTFDTVRQVVAQRKRADLRSAGGTEAELIRLYEKENEQLREKLEEQKEYYDGLLHVADSEREIAVQEAAAFRLRAKGLHDQNSRLKKKLEESVGSQITPIPTSLDAFETWCKEYLVGSVEIANRAYQGIRKTDFHDHEFIYRSLLLLRDHYVPMRIEATQLRKRSFEEALCQLNLEEAPTGDEVKRSFDLYSVQYGGRRRALDRHLKGSNSRDRRYGFRLYFFWEDDSQVVVVGWLPSHLDSRLS
jgi:hypothetical protein